MLCLVTRPTKLRQFARWCQGVASLNPGPPLADDEGETSWPQHLKCGVERSRSACGHPAPGSKVEASNCAVKELARTGTYNRLFRSAQCPVRSLGGIFQPGPVQADCIEAPLQRWRNVERYIGGTADRCRPQDEVWSGMIYSTVSRSHQRGKRPRPQHSVRLLYMTRVIEPTYPTVETSCTCASSPVQQQRIYRKRNDMEGQKQRSGLPHEP